MTYPNSAAEALEFLINQAQSNTIRWNQLCLKLARTSYDVEAAYSTAAKAWRHTKLRGVGTPPAGALIWWTGGSQEFGHVAVADGRGGCYGNWYPEGGKVRLKKIDEVTKRLGLTYVGWSRDINDVEVIKPAPLTHKVKPEDTLSDLAKRYGTTVTQLVEWNKPKIKDPDRISVGWVLKVRAA